MIPHPTKHLQLSACTLEWRTPSISTRCCRQEFRSTFPPMTCLPVPLWLSRHSVTVYRDLTVVGVGQTRWVFELNLYSILNLLRNRHASHKSKSCLFAHETAWRLLAQRWRACHAIGHTFNQMRTSLLLDRFTYTAVFAYREIIFEYFLYE